MSDDVLDCFLKNNDQQEKSSNLYREAAAYFADIVYPVVLEKVCNLSEKTHFHVSCEYDGYEVTVSDDLNNIKTTRVPEIPLINNFLSEIDIEINVEWDNEINEVFDVDGCLMTVEDEELSSNALVYVTAKIPSDPFVAMTTIKALHQEIVCVLVHEFRHAVQRILWGWEHESCEDLPGHMSNIAEIDARVEEMLSFFSTQEEVTRDSFISIATRYIKKYLLRNAKDISLETFNELFDKMLDLHLEYYYKRINVSYMTQPT